MDTNKTERQNNQLTPFNYEDQAVRTVLINDEPWFVAKDICDILGVKSVAAVLRAFRPVIEKSKISMLTHGGYQEMLAVSEVGLYRLVFRSRKLGNENFRAWVLTTLMPKIHNTYVAPYTPTFLDRFCNFFRTLCRKGVKTVPPSDRPGFPLELPAKGAGHE